MLQTTNHVHDDLEIVVENVTLYRHGLSILERNPHSFYS